MIAIGKRIKYFRERAKLSQFELENSLGFASGMISRIESDKVNPTKETVRDISKVLLLNSREVDYLIGSTIEPASEFEVKRAVDEVSNYLSKKGVMAYLIDDRWRVFASSVSFRKVMHLTQNDAQYYGKTIIELILLPQSGIIELLSKDELRNLLNSQLHHYFDEIAFMSDDYYFQRSLRLILSNPISREIWQNFQFKQTFDSMKENRKVKFSVLGFDFWMNYSREPLISTSRFELVEYSADNSVLRFISKFF